MKQWNKKELASTRLVLVFNYKPSGMKEVVTAPTAIKMSDLTTHELNMVQHLLTKHGYASRKLSVTTKQINNGKQQRISKNIQGKKRCQ